MKLFSFVYYDDREIEVRDDGTYWCVRDKFESVQPAGRWKIDNGSLFFMRSTDSKWTEYKRDADKYVAEFCDKLWNGLIKIAEQELLGE